MWHRPNTLTPQRPRLSQRPSRIVARLFLAVGLPAAVVVVVLGVLSWRTTLGAVEASLQRELAGSVAIAATTINASSARQVLPEEQEDSRTYKRMVARLKALSSSTGSVRVMLVDAAERVRADSDGVLRIGDPAPRVALDRLELRRALAGKAAVSVPFTGPDGHRYMAAYALVPEQTSSIDGDAVPVVPDDQRLVLAMEAPAAALDATFAVARNITALVTAAVLVVLLLAVVVARTITRPLLSLSESAERLAAGHLGDPLKVPAGDDEVSRLGTTLEAMRKALVDRDAERQMMLAGIAHEIRNPLGGMELFSGLLEEGVSELDDEKVGKPVKQELLEQTRRVKKELRYLTGVVNDFLAFAREAPADRADVDDVDVRALLEDVRSLTARPERAKVDVDDGGVGAFALDRNRIKQALLNLVENALQATPPEGTVTLRARLTDDAVLELVVEDTGKGMDATTAAQAFTPFFTTKEKGTGLGLALVRKLARDHGGDARIESTPGQGTRVFLRLHRA
ncbi:MAG: HAMP domain-containing sensor histidine kinase [Deltaproteobacteria bacterium]|nr:HAMP domain-containing sensor histidine kinase [Deltaproteobacteria bacterium]